MKLRWERISLIELALRLRLMFEAIKATVVFSEEDDNLT